MAVDDAAINRFGVMALQRSPGASRVAPPRDERPDTFGPGARGLISSASSSFALTHVPVARRSSSSALGMWPFVSLIPLGFGAWGPSVMGAKALMHPKAFPASKVWSGFAVLLGPCCSTLVAAGG